MDKLYVIETQLESLKKIYKKDLERKLSVLADSLAFELEQLRNNPYYKPNSCGIIQGSAQDIDNLCIKLGVIESIEK